MQPVKRGRSRGSQEFLLARGIAVRKRSGHLPVIARTRNLITRSPTSIRLARIGQDRVRGKWLALCVLLLGSAVVYGAIVGGQTAKLYDALTGGIEHMAVAAGFGVKRVTVAGQVHATDASITAALGAGPDTMMLNFDTDAAKQRLEAVPWIRHAQVMRLLPSTLQVVIEERDPFRHLAEQGSDLSWSMPRAWSSRRLCARPMPVFPWSSAKARENPPPRFTTNSCLMPISRRSSSPPSGSATGAGR